MMINSYLKVALKNARNRPFYTFINFTGLILGVACFVLISLFIWDELQFDAHHSNGDDIVRISQTTESPESSSEAAVTPFPLKETMLQEYPSYFRDGVRFFDLDSDHVSIANPETDERVRHDSFYFTDASVFSIFDVNLIRGSAETAFQDPASVVITPRIAELYFGEEDPVGQNLVLEGRIMLTVTAVMEDWGRHSHLRPEILAPMESLRNLWGNYDQMTSRWRWNTVWTYMLKEPGADLDGLTDQLPAFTDRYFSEYFSSEETIHLAFQPLTDIWLHSDLKVEISETGSFWQVLLFSVVAVLILVIACVNYVNLSTAQSALRAKEVGVRKTLGAENSGLMRQFMIESGIFTATAVAIGVLIAWLGAPYTETFTGRELSFGLLGGFELFVIIAVLIIAVTALAGFYPSVILSSLKPIQSLRGGGGGGRKGGKAGLRQGLTIFQFAVTAFLITGAAMVYVQYQHLQQRDMGFDPEDVIVVPSSMTTAIWFYDDFRERALTHPGVENVSGSKTVIGGEDFLRYQMVPEGYGADQERSYSKIFVMHDFVEAMGIEMAAGRSFSEEYSTDPQQALLINEAMVEELDWSTPEEALGRTFRLGEQEKTVVGVTRDFNHTYLRQELEPLVLELPSDENQMVANIDFIKVKLSSGDSREAITHLETIWDEIDQTHPFEYYFMQDKLGEIYASEGRLSSLMGLFSLVAIVIAALGLAGLGSYTMYTRTREVAIRKTLGASATGIFMMLSRDYLKLVLIAHVLALPVAWWFISRWFSGFPYQVNLPFYFTVIFGISIIASVLIALASISAQSLKAAYRDPAESLRND